MKFILYSMTGLLITLSPGCEKTKYVYLCDNPGACSCDSGGLPDAIDTNITQDADAIVDTGQGKGLLDNGTDSSDVLPEIDVGPHPKGWQLFYYHDYRDGPVAKAYSWGRIQFTKDGVQLEDPDPDNPDDAGAVYFTPVNCPNEWMMRAKMKLLTKGAEGQLLIRSSVNLEAESGIVLYHWQKNKGSVRQMVRSKKYDEVTYFTLPSDIELNRWYTLTFSFYNGVVKGYVDGKLQKEVSGTPAYPGIYTEPHFTAEAGRIVFQNLEIYRRIPQSGE